jgi:hypothetical protein
MKRSPTKIYFKKLQKFLNKTNHLKLFYIPSINSINSINRDYDINRFKYFFSIKKFLDLDYFIFNLKKFKETEVVFLTHYLGKKSLGDQDFYYGKIFKFLNSRKIKFTIFMLNKSAESINEIKKNSLDFKYSTVIINNYYTGSTTTTVSL